MTQKSLIELVFDDNNRLLIEKTRKKVGATPLGMPVALTVPKPQGSDPEVNFALSGSPIYLPLNDILSNIKRHYPMYVDNRPSGSVEEANAYVLMFSAAAVEPGDLIPGRRGREERDYCLCAVQFYKI